MKMKIPSNAVCVWKGKLFSARQWEQEQFDGTYKTFEGMKRFDSIQGIWVNWDRIILPYEIQPAREQWEFWLRWGMLEEWEIPIDAMNREFLEETWMVWDVSHVMDISKWWYVAWDEHIFVIKNVQKVQEPQLESGEKIEIKDVSFDEFIDILTKPWFRNSTFANYIIRHYILPNKKDALRALLFA